MWRSAGLAFLLSGLVLGGVRAGEASLTLAADAPPELVSPYHQYDLKLGAFYPAPRCPAIPPPRDDVAKSTPRRHFE